MKSEQIDDCINKGLSFYEKHFFTSDGFAKFYNSKKYPLDCTSASQAILLFCTLNKIDLALKVAVKTIELMQTKKGSFYFRKHKFYTDKNSFMRWSEAPMFEALSILINHLSKTHNNLE